MYLMTVRYVFFFKFLVCVCSRPAFGVCKITFEPQHKKRAPIAYEDNEGLDKIAPIFFFSRISNLQKIWRFKVPVKDGIITK